MPRSEIRIDLGALRRNARRLLAALEGAEEHACAAGTIDCELVRAINSTLERARRQVLDA